jgi:predicted porin
MQRGGRRSRNTRLQVRVALLALLSALPCARPARAQATEPTTGFEQKLTIYLFGAAMDGKVTALGQTLAVDVGFDQILDHLQFAAMGAYQLKKGAWGGSVEVIYMGLSASADQPSGRIDMDQWAVELDALYFASPNVAVIVGGRYNRLSGSLLFYGPQTTRAVDAAQDWVDPVVGTLLTLPLGKNFAVNLRADVGGFSAGSDLAWQVYPTLEYHVSGKVSAYVGYRSIYTDYKSGSGASAFHYDMTVSGPAAGMTLKF